MPKLEAEVRRDQIIRATYRAFANNGAANITLQDIADAAGCSKGVVAYHFGSKEEVYIALLEWLIEQIGARAREYVDAADTAEAKIMALVDATMVSCRENKRFFLVYLDFVAQGLRNPNFRRTNSSFFEGCRDVGREIWRTAQAEGIVRPTDENEAAAVTRALLDGLSIQWLFDDSASLEDNFEKYRRWGYSALRGYLLG